MPGYYDLLELEATRNPKDLRLALGLGQQVVSPMPVAGRGVQLYAAAAAEGLGSQDFVAILRLFEEWAGVEADAHEDRS